MRGRRFDEELPVRLSLCLLAAVCLSVALPVRAEDPQVAPQAIDAHLRFLAHDLLEGRAPATRGGQLAEEYIASIFQAIGLEGGAPDGGYFQTVPVNIVTVKNNTVALGARVGGAVVPLRFAEDIVVWSDRPRTADTESTPVTLDGEVVFVGYGIDAPEYRWNDFKGQDLRGKILLMLVNDPPATADEPNLFGGRAMTYYGRWTYKFEEAERQGAAAAILVHTTERAGYPWHTVVSSWSGPQRSLDRPSGAPAALTARAWITDTAARTLLSRAGLDFDALVDRATRRDAKPVPTGIRLSGKFEATVSRISARNVLARLPGSDPTLAREAVVFSAHHDHLGIGPAVDGDTIYNGASDNASGVANLLALAQSAVRAPRPKRTLYFAAVTAEEGGLLGSQYFVEHPSLPIERIVANLNMDGGNLLGRTRDLIAQGEDKSTLGEVLRTVARNHGLGTSPDPFPERGLFYRSDHFSFARAGVPALSVSAGVDFVGRPPLWGREQMDEYMRTRYHQPSDQYRPNFDLSGAAQLSQVVLATGLAVADAPTPPRWKTGSEFRRRPRRDLGVPATP